MVKQKYKPCGTEVQVLKISNLVVDLKPGENAEELVDKIEALIRRFSEDGKWWFSWKVEA